jgi:putative transposase
MEVDISLPASRVIRGLEQILEWRGKPVSIRCVNQLEYISGVLQAWAEKEEIALLYIQPDNPQQNAYMERYNRTVRCACLASNLFNDSDQVLEIATRWLWTYNNERPSMAFGGITHAKAGIARIAPLLAAAENGGGITL